jgi:hypothetical protein
MNFYNYEKNRFIVYVSEKQIPELNNTQIYVKKAEMKPDRETSSPVPQPQPLPQLSSGPMSRPGS